MRAIELKLSDKLFEVVSIDVIRATTVASIKIHNQKDFNRGQKCVLIDTGGYGNSYLAKPNSSLLIDKDYKSYKLFTTLEAAQKHQLRRRKGEMLRLLDKFKSARKEYEEFKEKYKNLPASTI